MRSPHSTGARFCAPPASAWTRAARASTSRGPSPPCGAPTLAVLPLGGAPGALVAELLDAQGISVDPVPVAGQTRSNIALAEPDGTLTKINAPGPELTPEEAESLLTVVGERSAGADWIACCGSLPRGLTPTWYAELVARAHAVGARIALDTSGPALLAALRERPDVVKPNAEELAEAVGRPLATVGDALKAAEELRDLGARAVLASLGSDGQLLVDGSGAWFATAPVDTVRSNVGAGDSSWPVSSSRAAPVRGRWPRPSPTAPRRSSSRAARCRPRPT